MQRVDIADSLGNGAAYIKFSFTYQDLTAAGLTQTIPILSDPGGNAFQAAGTTVATLNTQNFQIPQGGVILYARVKHSIQFAAPAATSLQLSIGKVGGAATAITAITTIGSLMGAVADTTLQETFAIASGQQSAFGLTANFTSVGGNLNTFTAGQVDLYIFYTAVTTQSQSFAINTSTFVGV